MWQKSQKACREGGKLMSWTSSRVTLLLDFWAAGWGAIQIGWALDLRHQAVTGKLTRLRAQEDAGMMQADLIRALAKHQGREVTLDDLLDAVEHGPPLDALKALVEAARGRVGNVSARPLVAGNLPDRRE
jgi:hypothetical protein